MSITINSKKFCFNPVLWIEKFLGKEFPWIDPPYPPPRLPRPTYLLIFPVSLLAICNDNLRTEKRFGLVDMSEVNGKRIQQ
jgi:hypothetical protein